MLLNLGFFKLVDGVEGVPQFVGVFDAVVFAACDGSDFLEGFGIKFLLWVCLDAVIEAALFSTNGDGIYFDA